MADGRVACVAGHVWHGACMAGGMHGWGVSGGGIHGRGCVWQRVCIAGSMHGRGACMTGWERVPCGRRDSHCSGQYASYWNAFLFVRVLIGKAIILCLGDSPQGNDWLNLERFRSVTYF